MLLLLLLHGCLPSKGPSSYRHLAKKICSHVHVIFAFARGGTKKKQARAFQCGYKSAQLHSEHASQTLPATHAVITMSQAPDFSSSSSRKRKLTWTATVSTSSDAMSSGGRESKKQLHPQEQQQLVDLSMSSSNDEEVVDVLEEVLAMCDGEIVPSIPNLQLFHYMLAYGHSDGSEGVCMDSQHRLSVVQSKIYERCIRFAAQHFSAATGNNHQSKFTPNEWIDTFCKLAIDTDSGVPRIKKFGAQIAAATSSAYAGHNADEDEEEVDLLSSVYSKEIGLMVGMFSNACQQCHSRRIVDSSCAKNSPEDRVDPYFPSEQLLFLMSKGSRNEKEGDEGEDDAMKKRCREDFIAWAVHLSEWVAEMYESCSLVDKMENVTTRRTEMAEMYESCSLVDKMENIEEEKMLLLLPCRKRMGITDDEYSDWCSVTASMARRRMRCIREVIIPSIRLLSTSACSSVAVIENVMTTCWKQLAMVNIEMVNMILFYISYTIRNKGENFVRLKLFSPAAAAGCENKKHSSSAAVLLTSKVATVMRLSVPSISPLISIRMVQFASGVYQLLARGDEAVTTRLLRSTFLLDQSGINGLQKVFRWVARGMVAAVQGAKLIEDHFSRFVLHL